MKSFIEFLTEDVYYHGTSHDRAKHIEAHGLDPSKSMYSGNLYLTKNYAEASKYSKIASNGKLGVVYRVHRHHLDPSKIHSEKSGIIQYKGQIKKEHLVKS